MTTQNQTIDSILTIIRACDSVILATCVECMPDARHLTNAMNKNVHDFNLFFLTGLNTPKFGQIVQNPKCCLYYFDSNTRHAVRLYGQMHIVNDVQIKHNHWHDNFRQFGYDGADDPNFVLMQFMPDSYKFYIGNQIQTGQI